MPSSINEIRELLLQLHKALLTYQQKQYEELHGPVGAPAKLFDLVLNNPDFEWLRRLSEAIVGLDGLLENEKTANSGERENFLAYINRLLTAQDLGNGFEAKYITALQKDPHVATLHGKLKQLLPK